MSGMVRQVLRVKAKSAAFAAEPLPELAERHIRVRTAFSAVSIGTEMTTVTTRPDGAALGYSASGIVEAVGADVADLKLGDRVAVYGAPYVHHATLLDVPVTLAAPVPEDVALEHAAFGGIGAIALHGVRQANLTFGERALVVGLGPVGHFVALILKAAGMDVVCVEPGAKRRQLAQSVGLTVVESIEAVEGPFDAALLTAHGPDDLLGICGEKLRLRGSLVVVGDLPVVIPREVMFSREIALSVSRAGGPGRYDPGYEAGAQDYPLAYVRWTEGRNLALMVKRMATHFDLSALVTHTFPAADAARAYAEISADRGATLGVLFDFKDMA
jgi:threonine dehydrogenase-like Zn-dependent dehydrogenase